MDFNKLFTVRPTSAEQNEWMITIGNEIATPERFNTREEAEERLTKTDFNLVAVLIHKMFQIELNQKES